MGKDTERYYYPYPRFERTSEVYHHLVEDAKRAGMPITDIIVLRLTDYYAGKPAIPPGAEVQQVQAGETTLRSDRDANALAAAQAWGNDDE